jgi:hypothetical protein
MVVKMVREQSGGLGMDCAMPVGGRCHRLGRASISSQRSLPSGVGQSRNSATVIRCGSWFAALMPPSLRSVAVPSAARR